MHALAALRFDISILKSIQKNILPRFLCGYISDNISDLQFCTSFKLQTKQHNDERDNNKAGYSKYNSIHYPPIIIYTKEKYQILEDFWNINKNGVHSKT